MRFWMRYTCRSSLRQGSSRQAPLISGLSSWDDVFLSAILLTLHLPYSSAHVCLSVGFPDGLCFLGNRHPCGIGWNLLAFSTCLQEPYTGFPRSKLSFYAALGLHSTPGYFCVRVSSKVKDSPFAMSFWTKPTNPFGFLYVTTLQLCIQFAPWLGSI